MGLDIKKLSFIVTLILMHLAERGKLGKIPEIAYELRRIRKGVEEVKHEVEGLRELTDYFRWLSVHRLEPVIDKMSKHGLRGVLRNVLELKTESESNPLTREDVELRRRPMEKSRRTGLSQEEVGMLREILDKKTREVFVEGIVGVPGFLALLFLIGLTVVSLTRGEGSNQT